MEQKTKEYLASKGLTFIQANYHCKLGELDLIMADGSTLVFIEVRYRRNKNYGDPLETVTRHKQRKLIRTAQHYLINRYRSDNIACRFDVVGVIENSNQELAFNWIQNAFY